MACNCNNNTVAKSTATVSISGTSLLITPTDTLSPDNEGRVSILITNGVPVTGASMPVVITLNSANVPVYDKFGNVLYGYGIRTSNTVLKGYYGNNGADATAHLQLVNYPYTRCCSCGY